MMGLDSCNLIKDTAIQQILEANTSEKELQALSENFAYSEPAATLAVAERIETRIKNIGGLKPESDTAIEVENAAWMMFLLGYQVGKQTHAYDLGEIQ